MVIFLEDDDVAAVKDGSLNIHRIQRNVNDSSVREVITLKMEIQQIMKGLFLFFLLPYGSFRIRLMYLTHYIGCIGISQCLRLPL